MRYTLINRKRVFTYEHIEVAEHALGRPLPVGAEVHHVDEDPANNRSNNLVICEDHVYHHLLHVRLRALREAGDAHARKCYLCRTWSLPGEEGFKCVVERKSPNGVGKWYHMRCNATYQRERKRRLKRASTPDPCEPTFEALGLR